MAHEIRTPIGILRSSAQMLMREPGLSGEGRELTSFIVGETERINGLVSTMLDSTRTREPKLKALDLNELIHFNVSLLSAQAEKGGITIAERLDAQPTIVNCDAEQMTQVLLNLIQNALQILPRGGRIDVSCRTVDESTRIEIADDGPGIDADAVVPRLRAVLHQARRWHRAGPCRRPADHLRARRNDRRRQGSAMGGALFTLSIPRTPVAP